jgi:FecR-like protein
MKTTVRFAMFNFFVLLFCGLAAAQEPAIKAPLAGATIADFKGKVSIQLPHVALSAPARGEVLPPESTVNTDEGTMLLRLTDGSEVLVRAHTRLVIKEPETSGWRYIQLMLGRIRTQVQKHLGGTPGFQIGTPSAVISVRGTKFDVEVDRRGVTEVDVEEGTVELDSLGGRSGSVLITAGFSSRVSAQSLPETPRPTHELRPELDRPGNRRDNKGGGDDDDPIKKLEARDRERHGHDSGDRSEGPGSTSGGDSKSGSDGGSQSGGSSGGSVSGSDSESGSGSGDHSDGDKHGSGKPPDLFLF